MIKLARVALSGLLMIGVFTSQVAWAGYVPSTQVMTTEQSEAYRSDIMDKLDTKAVESALQDQGVSKDEVKERVAMLSPSQIEELKTQLDTIPAGEGAVGVIVSAALFVFIVLLITDLVGATDVFDFDN